jgi:two-component system sensor histidine kinase/response regulator
MDIGLHTGHPMNEDKLSESELKGVMKGIFSFANKVNEGLLLAMFSFGIFIAVFYDTWLVAFAVGGLCLVAYYAAKKMLPDSDVYQYVLSGISAIFSAQFIYQMHGMAEMHFWVFICSTIMIIYQNWKLQIPLIVIVVIHHGSFAYLQYIGYKEIYFTQLDYMDLTTFLFHGVLAACVCVVSAYWSYTIYKRTIQDAVNLKTQLILKAELQEKNQALTTSEEELRASQEELLASQEELTQINENLNNLVNERTLTIIDQNKKFVHHAFINAHKVRSPLARIQGLVNLLSYEAPRITESGQEIHRLLRNSTEELDDILQEVKINLDKAEYKGLPENSDNEELVRHA